MVSKKTSNMFMEKLEETKTKIRNLIRLGIPESKAWMGNSRKSKWRISKSPILHKTLGNSYWNKQGLKCLQEHYEFLRQLY